MMCLLPSWFCVESTTEGEEYAFVHDRLAAAGLPVLLVDVGVLGEPTVRPDLDRRAVAAAADADLDRLVAGRDRNDAVEAMARGAGALLERLQREGGVAGLLVLGGSNAAFLMSRLAPVLPISIVTDGEVDCSTRSTHFSAISGVMSVCTASMFARLAWQYTHVSLQRNVTTKMCRFGP